MKVNICKCSNCETLLYDENPQTDAKYYNENDFDLEMMIKVDKGHYNFDNRNDGNPYWACPRCETDSYLDELI